MGTDKNLEELLIYIDQCRDDMFEAVKSYNSNKDPKEAFCMYLFTGMYKNQKMGSSCSIDGNIQTLIAIIFNEIASDENEGFPKAEILGILNQEIVETFLKEIKGKL